MRSQTEAINMVAEVWRASEREARHAPRILGAATLVRRYAAGFLEGAAFALDMTDDELYEEVQHVLQARAEAD